MNFYDESIELVEAICGNNKDNIIALSTIALENGNREKPCPSIRDVDAYYEEGVFYITTSANSAKMQQIAQNKNVAFTVCFEGFSGNGIGKNLGWVLSPENAERRMILREVFAEWYDIANNEQHENCIILAIKITDGILMKDHGAVRYHIDFINKTAEKQNNI